MPKQTSMLTSPKIKKLAAKALKSPSMLTTAETRELGASVMAHLQPVETFAVKGATRKTAAGQKPARKTAKKAAKKSSAKTPKR